MMNTDFHFGARLFFFPVSYCQFERDIKYFEVKKQYRNEWPFLFFSWREF